MEKIRKPVSGYAAFLIALLLLGLSVYFFIKANDQSIYHLFGILSVLGGFFLLKGLMIIQPNHSRVLNFFGKYVGSVKDNGMFFINPFFSSSKISLRSQNL